MLINLKNIFKNTIFFYNFSKSNFEINSTPLQELTLPPCTAPIVISKRLTKGLVNFSFLFLQES